MLNSKLPSLFLRKIWKSCVHFQPKKHSLLHWKGVGSEVRISIKNEVWVARNLNASFIFNRLTASNKTENVPVSLKSNWISLVPDEVPIKSSALTIRVIGLTILVMKVTNRERLLMNFVLMASLTNVKYPAVCFRKHENLIKARPTVCEITRTDALNREYRRGTLTK